MDEQRGERPWMVAFMLIVGVIALLPGVCGLVAGVSALSGHEYAALVMPIALVGLLIGFSGILVIIAAIKRIRHHD